MGAGGTITNQCPCDAPGVESLQLPDPVAKGEVAHSNGSQPAGRITQGVNLARPAENLPEPGWFITGTIPAEIDERNVQLRIGAAQIDPADLEQPDDRHPLESFLNFTTFQDPIPIVSRTFGPAWVGAADGYAVAARHGNRIAYKQLSAPKHLPHGTIWNIGELPFEARPSLTFLFTARAATKSPFSLHLSRSTPTPQGTHDLPLQRAITPGLVDVLYHGAPARVHANEYFHIPVLPEEGRWTYHIESPTGAHSRDITIDISPGEQKLEVVDLESLIPRHDWTGLNLNCCVVHEDGSPAGNAQIADTSRSRTLITKPDGTFILDNVPAGADLVLSITHFDPRNPGRAFEFRRAISLETATQEITIIIPETRWIVAKGLARPSGMMAQTPMAFVVETPSDSSAWKTLISDIFESIPGGVRVSAPSNGTACRIVAIWNPLFYQYSTLVEITPDRQKFDVSFLPAESGVGFLRGIVKSPDGAGIGNAVIEAQGVYGGVPPETLRTEPDGSFLIGPVNSRMLSLRYGNHAFAGEIEIIPPADGIVECTALPAR